jgi:serine/threonine protein kinase
MQEQHRKPLEPGYEVGGYDIVRVVGQGGFGIVYEARNATTLERVAIKQFYPNALASWRHGTIVVNRDDDREFLAKILKRFQEEARLQFNFDHPNILKVKNFVSAHNTGYMITEYIDGSTLVEFLKPHGSIFPNEAMFRAVMEPILSAVKYVHEQGALHRDISPDNIMIDNFGKPVLVDFGAAKLDLLREPSASSVVAYREEYAPVEQREPSIERPEGYYTDIFALAGTMYRLLSGKPPVGSITRSLASKDPYVPVAQVSKAKCSEAMFKAIDRGLALPPASRPASVDDFKELLGWTGVPPPPPEPPPPPPEPGSTTWPRYLSVVLPIVAVLGLLVYVSRQDEINSPPPSAETPAAIASPGPAVATAAAPPPTPAASSATAEPSPATPTPDPRIATEKALYESALKCIQDSTSCEPDACLTPYRSGIGYADRYPSLREEYEKVKRSPRCAPKPVINASPSTTPDPRIALEQKLYDSTLKCIHDSTSCDTDPCLTEYRNKIGFADRYPALRKEYTKVIESPRCAPAPVATASPAPTPDPRIIKENALYASALKCIQDSTSCDTDACLTSYRNVIGYADRYPSLQEEYEKVKRSPRCAPPPPITYRIFENRDIDGGDLPGKPPHLVDVDQQTCSSTCDITKDCIGYSYGKWDRACYLKQSLPDLRYDPNSTAAIRSNQIQPPDFQGPTRIEKTQRNFAGNRYATSPASSRGACSRMCELETACLGYQFTGGACWRYDRIDFATKDPAAQSGVKRQLPPS